MSDINFPRHRFSLYAIKLDYESFRLLLSQNRKVGKCRAIFLIFACSLNNIKTKTEKIYRSRFSRRTRCFSTRAPCIRKKDENVLLEVVKIRVLRLRNASTRCFILTTFWRWGGETANEQKNKVFLFSFMALEKCNIKIYYPIWFNKLALVFKCLSMTFRISRKIVFV